MKYLRRTAQAPVSNQPRPAQPNAPDLDLAPLDISCLDPAVDFQLARSQKH